MLNLDFLLWLKCPLRTTPTSSGSLNPESLWKDTDFLRLGCSAPSLVTSSTTTVVRFSSWRPLWGSAILEQPVISQNSCADSADDCLPGLYDRSIWWCDVGGGEPYQLSLEFCMRSSTLGWYRAYLSMFEICATIFDKVTVPESWVRFASKTLTPRRMH